MKRAVKRTLIFLLTTLLMLCASSALAGTAYPGIVDFTEPATGEIVEILNHGDEHFSCMTDPSGDLLVVDANGRLRYVTESGGVFSLGAYKTQVVERAVGTRVNVSTATQLQSKLQALRNKIAASQPVTYKQVREDIPLDYDFVGDRAEGRAQVCTTEEDTYLDDTSNYPKMGSTCPLLVLKLQFEDIKCIFSDQEWHDRVFENGITQYYQAVSNGKFTYEPVKETWGTANDGVVTVTLPFNCPRYTLADESNQLVQNDPAPGLYRGSDGKNYAIYNMGSLYAYAMLAAESSVDFRQFDRNNDGFISPTELAVLVVYSGFEASLGGAEAAQGRPGVWAHSWKYNNLLSNGDEEDYHYMTMTVGGKRVSKYTVIGELANYVEEYNYDTKEGTPRQAQYGTASHELGHDMGLPDLYPTGDLDPYPSQQVDGLSLMASGSWGRKTGEELGSCPTHLDPLSKIYLGFYTAAETDNTGKYTLYATEPSPQYNILRVNTEDPNIYYLIENRQLSGYDEGLYLFYGPNAGGLVIWRADQEVLSSLWQKNTINNEEGHYGLMPVFVDGLMKPFWSLDSDPSDVILNDAPLLKYSSLSQSKAVMDLLIEQAVFFVDGSKSAVYIDLEVPALLVDTPLTALDVSAYVGGGNGPYTFSLSRAPSWLHITPEGVLYGTPTGPSAATTAVITVTDALGQTASITIAVGAVTNAPTPPQTGDTQPLLLYAALLAASAAGLLWLRRRSKTAHR